MQGGRGFARGAPLKLERLRALGEERDAQHVLQWGREQMRASGAVSLAFRNFNDPAAIHIERSPGRSCQAKISPRSPLMRGEQVGGEGPSNRAIWRRGSSGQGAEWPRIRSERESGEVELVSRTKTGRQRTTPHPTGELRLREDHSAWNLGADF